MGGALESKFRRLEDAVDVLLPQSSRFWVALQGVQDRQNHGSI